MVDSTFAEKIPSGRPSALRVISPLLAWVANSGRYLRHWSYSSVPFYTTKQWDLFGVFSEAVLYFPLLLNFWFTCDLIFLIGWNVCPFVLKLQKCFSIGRIQQSFRYFVIIGKRKARRWKTTVLLSMSLLAPQSTAHRIAPHRDLPNAASRISNIRLRGTLARYGNIWQLMATYGNLCQLMAIFPTFLTFNT